MILKFLGIGSAFNSAENNTSAYIKKDGHLLLIDCGETTFRRIQTESLLLDIDKVDIIITHMHTDHIGSLSSLIFYLHFVKGIKANIYFPEDTINDYLKLCGNTREQYNFFNLSLYYHNSIADHLYTIYPIKTEHVKEINSYAYIIGIENEDVDDIIYYSGDTTSTPSMGILTMCNEIYQDTCSKDYEGNVHCSINKLDKEVPDMFRSKICCIHLDNTEEDFLHKLILLGFRFPHEELSVTKMVVL